MFDISWTEFMLIGVVALVVIGPKELPAVMRTVGQWTRKARTMASEFQNQFHEAMREAEMADLKKQVDEITHEVKNFDPLKDVRSEVEAAGKDIQASLTLDAPVPSPAPAATEPEAASVATDAAAASASPPEPAQLPQPEPELPLPVAELPLPDAAELRDSDVAGTADGPVAPAGAAKVVEPDSTGRAG